MTLTPIAERLAVKLYDLRLSRLGFEHQTLRLRDERSKPLRHRRGSTTIGLHFMFNKGQRIHKGINISEQTIWRSQTCYSI